MKNKTIAHGLTISLSLAFLGGVIELSDEAYTILGLSILIFGAFAAHKLYKIAD